MVKVAGVAVWQASCSAAASHACLHLPRSNAVLAASPGKLVLLMASLTWCRPCKAFQDKYEASAAAACLPLPGTRFPSLSIEPCTHCVCIALPPPPRCPAENGAALLGRRLPQVLRQVWLGRCTDGGVVLRECGASPVHGGARPGRAAATACCSRVQSAPRAFQRSLPFPLWSGNSCEGAQGMPEVSPYLRPSLAPAHSMPPPLMLPSPGRQLQRRHQRNVQGEAKVQDDALLLLLPGR